MKISELMDGERTVHCWWFAFSPLRLFKGLGCDFQKTEESMKSIGSDVKKHGGFLILRTNTMDYAVMFDELEKASRFVSECGGKREYQISMTEKLSEDTLFESDVPPWEYERWN